MFIGNWQIVITYLTMCPHYSNVRSLRIRWLVHAAALPPPRASLHLHRQGKQHPPEGSVLLTACPPHGCYDTHHAA